MKKIFRSRILMWVSILALLAVTVGGTLALMATQANTVTNQFTVADVDTEIKEDLTGSNKQVSITNHGESPVYVRARIMVSGVAADKVQVVSSTDAMSDPNKVYLVMENTTATGAADKWQKDGGNTDDFYYYLGIVPGVDASGKVSETSRLLEKVVLGKDLQTDDVLKNFSVTIYHESVLAIGTGTDLASVQNAFKAAGAEIA